MDSGTGTSSSSQVKPQLRCYGRRNRSKPPPPPPDSSDAPANAPDSAPAPLPLPGSPSDAEIESGPNAAKGADIFCVQATQPLDELTADSPPPPTAAAGRRFASEEEQAAYEDEVLCRANGIWSRQEAFEQLKRLPTKWKEPPHSKSHWDYVLEEMSWLAKDYDKERKWKLASAKRLAQKASKSRSEVEVKGLRRIKSEEQRIRRIASNISKEVKKFWVKIEKLVVYKHQLAVDEKKKKALDKHLEFLLGQTERYSSMLAVNLSGAPEEGRKPESAGDAGDVATADEDFVRDDVEEEDDEATIEADEALITADERKEELDALERESDLPLEELMRLYARDEDEENDRQSESGTDEAEEDAEEDVQGEAEGEEESDEAETEEEAGEFEEANDGEYTPNKAAETDEDDERTFDEEEKLAMAEGKDTLSELEQLRAESELPVPELLSRYHSAHPESSDKCEAEPDDPTAEARERMGEPSTSGRVPLLIIKDASKSRYMGVENFTDGTEQEAQVLANVARAAQQRGERMRRRAEKETDIDGKTGRKELDEAAAAAQSAQPTGYTFSTTRVRTKVPFLLKHSLREYQHIGLDWLVTMYEKRLNGILADEMGLGKTIMTIALLAHLACEKGIWGPHLIVVPTSVMLNWETEFMKWCPAFKILTYFGNAKERKIKRQGWSKANSFHICITTYRLVIQDAKAFKRKKWKYLILDEAHLIKNWKSQRWQMLLNFNSKRRILLTGTPLQNDLMELWSLMHFLMPHVFQSHQEFKDWFSNPITGMIEGQEKVNHDVVDRLHNVLRPFLLRRLKRDVEKQLPGKHEHVVPCRLSKRQRNLYEDFMANSDTQATLSSGNFLGLINVLMQLRKVCNHPDLFESRPIVSSFDMPGLELQYCSDVCGVVQRRDPAAVDLSVLNLLLAEHLDSWEAAEMADLATPKRLIEEIASTGEDTWDEQEHNLHQPQSIFEEIQTALRIQRLSRKIDRARHQGWLNILRCCKHVVYGSGLRRYAAVEHPVYDVHSVKSDPSRFLEFSSALAEVVKLPSTWSEELIDLLQAFVFVIPAARAPPPLVWCSRRSVDLLRHDVPGDELMKMSRLMTPLRPIIVRRQLFFPDRRLLQFDCGKLQELSVLLRRLKSEGHRALIFTQMTKMLDILESFINLYGYTYMRLDGSTKPEQRQILMQRFNTNPKIFLFILSTRSGGVGINLVGADTVIFYDSDWNPAMDQQAQDRCHRIGQTREVHIYRLVSESTIEENILKKANQKRFLDDLVIQSGGYNTEFFKKLDPMELLSGVGSAKRAEQLLSSADVDAALRSAEDEADYMAMKNVELEEAADIQEFAEDVSVDDDACVDDLEDGKPVQTPEAESKTLAVTEVKEPEAAAAAAAAAPVEMDAEEEMDMLADVKQLAAAAAASGRGSTYFEDQLKPIERYAIQFLDLWDPVIDTAALETQVTYEEKEWELEQLEKLKEEQEAEIDEDDEPLVYENWDTSHADAAYRQQVEQLTQQQELLQAEWEEEMEEAARIADKKAKKKKFKSLGRGTLEPEDAHEAADGNGAEQPDVADEADEAEVLSGDDMDYDMQWRPFSQRKRKPEDGVLEIESKRFRDGFGSSKPRFVINIYGKRPIILLEKDRRKENLRSRSTDAWTSDEDIVLCAVANEYGANWRLASDALQGMAEGGVYCGRYRHPFRCKDRYKQLVADNGCGDIGNVSSSVLRITEEDTKRLLKITERVPDHEMLLQRHFGRILKARGLGSTVSTGLGSTVSTGALSTVGQPRGPPFISLADLSQGIVKPPPQEGGSAEQGYVLVAEALRSSELEYNGKVVEPSRNGETMDLTLTWPDQRDLEYFAPVTLTLVENSEPELVSAPCPVVRTHPVIESRYRSRSGFTPAGVAATAFAPLVKHPPAQSAIKRQSPPNNFSKLQRAKQARPGNTVIRNGMVEIRPVEVKTLSLSPSQLKPANLNKPPLFSPGRVHNLTALSRQSPSSARSSSLNGIGKVAVVGASSPQQIAQYWRADAAQSPSSNSRAASRSPNHSQQQQQRVVHQQKNPQQQQQRQFHPQLQKPGQLQHQQRQAQQQPQRQAHQQQQQQQMPQRQAHQQQKQQQMPQRQAQQQQQQQQQIPRQVHQQQQQQRDVHQPQNQVQSSKQVQQQQLQSAKQEQHQQKQLQQVSLSLSLAPPGGPQVKRKQ